ncbi:Protein of unknown function [Pyronema omphalodes CBS 100304]|uniref:Uncharacterized protein n=1 Tax=Pyronema omphalodes (strain CBS 100304) TaxID=1076935 RepID=U4KV95_PYROM|nr:Protein of unknown function [Pyronema omphalodes CBS 100304]
MHSGAAEAFPAAASAVSRPLFHSTYKH